MLNERIRQLRVAKNYNQVELANALAVTKQSVSNWENNNIQPLIDILIKLADFFGVTTDFLLGREDSTKLSVEGFSAKQIQHINMIIEDIRGDG